jgi:predicted nuclease of predicted toxin-antitoxin system
MLRLIADECFNGHVYDGLLQRRPALAIVRVQDVGLSRALDPVVLAWADANDRIILSHDHTTLPDYAYEHLATCGSMGGVIVIPDDMPIRQAIQEILIADECSEQQEWRDRVYRFPI